MCVGCSGATRERRNKIIMSAQAITPELREWIIEQVGLGHRPDAVLRSMCDTGWDRETALTALEETIAGYLDDFAERQHAPSAKTVDRLAQSPGANECWVDGHAIQVLASLHVPPIVMFGQVLSSSECDALIQEARPRLQHLLPRGKEAAPVSKVAQQPSAGMVFGPGETMLCSRVERRISGLLEEPIQRCQGLQVLCYPAGAQYKPQEYLGVAVPSDNTRRSVGGSVSVLLIYLNTPEQGGSTLFPEIGLEVNPVQGNGLFFSHDQSSANSRGLHAGAPVFRGEQWVLLKWLETAAPGPEIKPTSSPGSITTTW